MTEPGDILGFHRVIHENADEPLPLPQRAFRLDNDPDKVFESEIVLDVETLNIDAASFRQMEEAAGNADGVGELVQKTVRERGKQHNPVTGSGGMLLGRVASVGELARERGFAVGDRVATLASLSLTPLRLSEVKTIRPVSAQVDVVGKAMIFGSAPMAKLPSDLPERLAIAALDVAGAAPQVARLARANQTVVVLGAGGKSGLLCALEARRRVGPSGMVIGVESHAPFADDLEALGICSAIIRADARDLTSVRDPILAISGGLGAHLTLSCVNIGGCEMSAIASTRDRGKVYFFAMSTSFTACALGAEGIGADVDLFIGNGYAHGHADHTLELLRSHNGLRAIFDRRYG